jgi:FG-GAP-like repeat
MRTLVDTLAATGAVSADRERSGHAHGRGSFLPVLAIILFCIARPAAAQFIQQGDKLVGTAPAGGAAEGFSVALSADGNTEAIGGNYDAGAVWVFTRSGGNWTQQAKLVGTGVASGPAGQGASVALSADGNTLIEGGPDDGTSNNSDVGAVWVFSRSNGVWSQQAKLIGSGYTGESEQGASVALSADGNTAIVGGPGDNSGNGGVWVFTRSGGKWTQQGSELIGDDVVGGDAGQGTSVALSADGNTAIVGGPNDGQYDLQGAVWIYTRSGGKWTQQGSKLVPDDVTDGCCAQFGTSVALSADGNTAAAGGTQEDTSGAAWVFTRSGVHWTQQGSKLVGSGVTGGNAFQGQSVALSADGNTLVEGGDQDNYGDVGAVWVFTRSGTAWTQLGSKLVGSGYVYEAPFGIFQGYAVALSADANTVLVGGYDDNQYHGAAWVFVRANPTNTHDFDGDGESDVLWRQTGGKVVIWKMNGEQAPAFLNTSLSATTAWQIEGTGDFDAGGHADIVWRNSNGQVAVWLMNGGQVTSAKTIGTASSDWVFAGTGDFDGDGKSDLLWRSTSTGKVAIWKMNGIQAPTFFNDVGTATADWQIMGTGDFDGDGTSDILWRNTSTGKVVIWLMKNGAVKSYANASATATNDWVIAGTGDFDGDGRSDILWRQTGTGKVAIWEMNGGQVKSSKTIATVASAWQIAGTGDFEGNGKSDILWRNSNGQVAVWLMNGEAITSTKTVGSATSDWQIQPE